MTPIGARFFSPFDPEFKELPEFGESKPDQDVPGPGGTADTKGTSTSSLASPQAIRAGGLRVQHRHEPAQLPQLLAGGLPAVPRLQPVDDAPPALQDTKTRPARAEDLVEMGSLIESFAGPTQAMPEEFAPRDHKLNRPMLMERMRDRIGQVPMEDIFNCYARPGGTAAASGRECWLGNEAIGITEGILLDVQHEPRDTQPPKSLRTIRVYSPEIPPSWLLATPDCYSLGRPGGGFIHHLVVPRLGDSKGSSPLPGFWVPRGEEPSRDQATGGSQTFPPRTSPSRFQPIGDHLHEFQGIKEKTAFHIGINACWPVHLPDEPAPSPGKVTVEVESRDGSKDRMAIAADQLYILPDTPYRDTPRAHWASTDRFSTMRLNGMPVNCWGHMRSTPPTTYDKENDLLVVWSPTQNKALEALRHKKFPPEPHQINRDDLHSQRPVKYSAQEHAAFAEQGITVPVVETTKLHDYFLNRKGFLYHIPLKPELPEDTKRFHPPPAFTTAETVALQAVKPGRTVTINGQTAIAVTAQREGSMRQVVLIVATPSDTLMAASGLPQHPAMHNGYYQYTVSV